jgi:hypothetical protein
LLIVAALEKYEELQKQNPNDLEIMIGRMRCMQFLSDWNGVARVAEQVKILLFDFVWSEKNSQILSFFSLRHGACLKLILKNEKSHP